MDQHLGRGVEKDSQEAPTHPGIMLIKAIDDSSERRGIETQEDHTLRVGVEIELAYAGIGDGTINGYSAELQRNWARMLGKNAWRS